MTDEEKIELARGMYAAWTRGDLTWVLEHTIADFELVQAREIPGASTYRGPEGLEDLFHRIAEIWREFVQEPTEFKVAGDRLAVIVHQRARGKESGIEVEQDVGHLVEFRGPDILRVMTYRDPADALRALEPSR